MPPVFHFHSNLDIVHSKYNNEYYSSLASEHLGLRPINETFSSNCQLGYGCDIACVKLCLEVTPISKKHCCCI